MLLGPEKPQSDVVVKQPPTQIPRVTKLIEVIRYINKTVAQVPTLSAPVPGEAKQGLQMSNLLPIVIGK